MNWFVSLSPLLLFTACSGPEEGIKPGIDHASDVILVDTVAANTISGSAYDTLSYFIDRSHTLNSTIKVAIEMQPLVDYDSSIVKDYFGTLRFRFLHNDTQFVANYPRETLQKFDHGVCIDTV